MAKFQRENIFSRLLMVQRELEDYYCRLRKYDYASGKKMKGYHFRNIIHPLLLNIVKLDRAFAREAVEIIGNKSKKTEKPVIFACAHIGGNDLQRTFEAIKKHAYVFLRDPKELYKDFNGFLLFLNGCIIIETSDKEDRAVGMQRSIEILENKQNLLIYPEGVWNISENALVLELYPGIIRMALQIGAEIIPMAIEQYENKFKVNIGENMQLKELEGLSEKELKIYLRDILATLKYEIIETEPVLKSRKLINYYKQHFTEDIIKKCKYNFTRADIEAATFHNKDIVSIDEAYAFQK